MPKQPCPIHFDAETHTYTEIATKRKFMGCTSIIHAYSNPFDPDGGILFRFAKKIGKSCEEVAEMWKVENVRACDYGHGVHAELEHFIKTAFVRESEHDHWVYKFENWVNKNIKGKCHAEKLVYSLKHGIAGQVDVIEVMPDNTVNVYDFKTNKKLSKSNAYGAVMLEPFSHLDDCNFNHYRLQLSLYMYLLGMHGLTPGKIVLLYLNPETNEIEEHPIEWMKAEARTLLKAGEERLKHVIPDAKFTTLKPFDWQTAIMKSRNMQAG